MKLWDTEKNVFEEGIIDFVSNVDYLKIRKSDQFQFDWTKEKKNLVYKICKKNEEEILGLISLIDFSKELRIEIHLIEISKSNIGKNKKFDRLADCLIAYACNLAFIKNYDGFVSLVSKSEIVKLYKEKYGFIEMGNHLNSQLNNSNALINEYLK